MSCFYRIGGWWDEMGQRLEAMDFVRVYERRTSKNLTRANPLEWCWGPPEVRGPQFKNPCIELTVFGKHECRIS
ncbi:hypothetical protein TNCV_329751 [Trichonephila clavipes]|nr:hypothetical protein TNCV_329751 [Trichonephila clavipes]